jgi:class 3 adenylate cyclase
MAADDAGYSRLMSADEEATVRTLDGYRRTMSDLISEHAGGIFGSAGDSVIAEFRSAVQAVRAAVAIQRSLDRHNAGPDRCWRPCETTRARALSAPTMPRPPAGN